jgi:hypothetical protein
MPDICRPSVRNDIVGTSSIWRLECVTLWDYRNLSGLHEDRWAKNEASNIAKTIQKISWCKDMTIWYCRFHRQCNVSFFGRKLKGEIAKSRVGEGRGSRYYSCRRACLQRENKRGAIKVFIVSSRSGLGTTRLVIYRRAVFPQEWQRVRTQVSWEQCKVSSTWYGWVGWIPVVPLSMMGIHVCGPCEYRDSD